MRCTECTYFTYYKSQLKIHTTQRHSDVRKSLCTVCRKSFKYLDRHMKINHNTSYHTGKKNIATPPIPTGAQTWVEQGLDGGVIVSSAPQGNVPWVIRSYVPCSLGYSKLCY